VITSTDSVTAEQVWAEAFFGCIEKLRTYDVDHANSAADFADAVLSRFRRALGAAGELPAVVDDEKPGGILPNLVNREVSGIRFGDMPPKPGDVWEDKLK
jgi:hypothetical protein